MFRFPINDLAQVFVNYAVGARRYHLPFTVVRLRWPVKVAEELELNEVVRHFFLKSNPRSNVA